MLIVCTSWYHTIVILSVTLTHPHPVFKKNFTYQNYMLIYFLIIQQSNTCQEQNKAILRIRLTFYTRMVSIIIKRKLASPLFSSYQQLSLKSTRANIQLTGLTVPRSLRPSELPAPGFGSSLSPAPFSILVCLCLCSWVELITGSRLWLNTPAAITHLLQISSAGQLTLCTRQC